MTDNTNLNDSIKNDEEEGKLRWKEEQLELLRDLIYDDFWDVVYVEEAESQSGEPELFLTAYYGFYGREGSEEYFKDLPLRTMIKELTEDERREFAEKYQRHIQHVRKIFNRQEEGWARFKDAIQYEEHDND